MDEKIRILFLSANPWNTSRIRVDEEAREIFEKLEQGSERHAFELVKYPGLRPGDLQRLLMKHKPHIVHFSGHGSPAEKIILQGASGRGKQIQPGALVNVFRLYKDHVRVVVLNACLTRQQALALNEVVDYAIGIDAAIGDKEAVVFAGAFYLALTHKMSVQESFESAKAELGIRDLRRAKGLELFVREGTNPTEPFPPDNDKTDRSDQQVLAAALRHLLDNKSSEDEKEILRRATLDGALILGQTDDVAKVAGTIVESSRASGPGTALRTDVDPATYRRLQEELFPPPPGLPPPLPGLIVVGRDDALVEVKDLLQSAGTAGSESNLTVVRGWPGVGKTTLVGVLGRDPEMLKEFPDGVLWTALERKPELMTKLAEWGRALGTDDLLRTPTLDNATAKLAALIRHRRMLLIVDDIWDAAHAVPFLKAATDTRCGLLATTRLPEVANALTNDEKRIYIVPVLSEADSLVLLHYLAPMAVEQYPNQCRELANDLGYLPLALHVAGRLLRAEAKIGLNVIDLIQGIRDGVKLLEAPAPLDRTEGTVLPTVQALLKRSTDELDEQARDCFAYLGPFAPKPATFGLDAMKDVWQVEDPAAVVRKLVNHGLLEPVGAGRFQMHELLVKHANSLLD